MAGTDLVAGAAIGAVAGHVVDDVLPDLTGDAPYDHLKHHATLQTKLLDQIAQMLQQGREDAARAATTTELQTITANQGYEMYSGGKRTSVFTTTQLTLSIRSAIGTTLYALDPGWNALDAPDGSIITLGPGEAASANLLFRWSPLTLDIEYNTGAGDSSLVDPASTAFPIAVSDTQNLPQTTRGIAMGVVGDLHVLMRDGTEVTIPSGVLASGMIHALRVQKVFNTGTTATGIWGFA
jgi:hypothetical protein